MSILAGKLTPWSLLTVPTRSVSVVREIFGMKARQFTRSLGILLLDRCRLLLPRLGEHLGELTGCFCPRIGSFQGLDLVGAVEHERVSRTLDVDTRALHFHKGKLLMGHARGSKSRCNFLLVVEVTGLEVSSNSIKGEPSATVIESQGEGNPEDLTEGRGD